MTSFLAGSLANAIAAGFRGKLLTGTLRKVTTASRDEVGDPVSSSVDYPAQGFPENFSDLLLASAVPFTDVKIVLVAGLTGAVPSIGDKISMRSAWFQIRDVKPDPALATYECQCFKAP